MTYMNTIYIDSNDQAYTTAVGAEFETSVQTIAAFESIRHHDIGIKNGQFIIDLHNDKGEIVDSIAVTAESYAQITGEPVLSEAEYIAIDRKFWQDQRKLLKAA